MHIRPLFTLLACALLAREAGAQRPGGQRPDAKGRIIGRLLEEASSEPVPFASVTLLNARDSILNGTLTRANGDFAFDAVPMGRCTVRITSMGYEDLEVSITMTPALPEKDLGDLRMKVSAVVMQQAEVTAEASRMQLQVDRRVYNVEKDLSVRGGTGEDVMKNVPGLSVDVDGGITLRNATPQILIDGRPTSLTLDMIPAEDIERVEVITTPGAQFEANTTGGIVNVVLKRSNKPGYSGQVQGGAGSNGRYNGSANLNVKEEPFTYSLSGNFNLSNANTTTGTDRTDRINGEDLGSFTQDGESESERFMRGFRAGIEWNVTNRNTLGANVSYNRRSYENLDEQWFTNTSVDNTVASEGDQVNTQENSGGEWRPQLSFRRRSPRQGHEWTTDLTWNISERSSRSDFITDYDDPAGNDRTQHNEGSSNNDQLTWQLDVQDPRNENNKIDWGARISWRKEHSELDVTVDDSSGVARYDSVLSNVYDVNDRVYAAYGNWSHRFDERWSLLTGLRIEATNMVAELPTKNEEYRYVYPDGTDDIGKILFPGVYLSRKWEGSREFQVNFSRKINRPNFWQVMPFVMFSDSRSYRIGNPALGPEFTWIGETNHLLPIGSPRNTWLTSVFAKYTTDVITNYVYPKEDDPEVLVSTFVNGDDSWTYGWDNTFKLEPAKGLQGTAGVIIQYIEVGMSSINARNSGWTFNGKLNLSQRINSEWAVQVNGEYEGQRPIPQGHSMPQYGVDVSVNYEPNKRLSITGGVNDVFDTRRWGNVYDTDVVYQESYRRRDSRHARISISWKFGEQNSSLFRRRTNQRREPGAEGGEGGDM